MVTRKAVFDIFVVCVSKAPAVLCGREGCLSTRIAPTKPWLELRVDQKFEGEEGLMAVEHHGSHHRRLRRGQ